MQDLAMLTALILAAFLLGQPDSCHFDNYLNQASVSFLIYKMGVII